MAKIWWVFWGTFRNQFEFSTSLTYRIRQNYKMTLKKPQKLLCEIKKKRKATIWRKIWDKVVAAPEKKIWSNSCTIPQIKYHKNYCHNWIPDFYEEKKIILFLSTTSWLYPKNIANWEWCYYYCVFFAPHSPFLFLIPHQLITPLYYVLRLLIKKLGHNILNCKNGWILSALKKKVFELKNTPKKSIKIITISTTKTLPFSSQKRKRKYQPKKKRFLNMIEVIRPF